MHPNGSFELNGKDITNTVIPKESGQCPTFSGVIWTEKLWSLLQNDTQDEPYLFSTLMQ